MKIKLKDKVFDYRFAKKEDINKCLYLDKKVWNSKKKHFHEFYFKDELLRSLKFNNRIIVVFYKNKLVAFSTVEFADNDRLNWLNEFNISKKEFLQSGYLGGTVVSLKYRGYGLQNFLIKKREEYMSKIGCKYSLVSVHPKNKYSFKNVLDLKYKLITKKKNVFGNIRYFLRKKL